MSTVDRTVAFGTPFPVAREQLAAARAPRPRSWIVGRALVVADLVGLLTAWVIASHVYAGGLIVSTSPTAEGLFFLASLPLWIALVRLVGLYKHDAQRPDHSTADELFGIFLVATVGTWLFTRAVLLAGFGEPDLTALTLFSGSAIGGIAVSRIGARAFVRRRPSFLQNTIIVGAGEVGQLVARKLVHHPEYGVNLLGFVDADPKELRADLHDVVNLGAPDRLPELVRQFNVERVVIAFSNEPHEELVELVRTLRQLPVQIDIVPRLFEVLGPGLDVHSVEALPLVGLPASRISRGDHLLKRAVDIAVSLSALVLSAPVLLLIALWIKRDSAGPVFFRQTRLGMGMREFTLFKFRTMRVDTDDASHREYIRSIMSSSATLGENGLYKLDREDAVTRAGRWLRRLSLDEVPQLINVLRGDMSLVGPRPCLQYETEHFAPHHFERFHVPAGVTGLWQVSARAHASFGEALDMDVQYARSWSHGLDLRLLLRTPLQLLRSGGTT